jgi:ribosomal protein S18 acetylase RimI-like enzyme
VINSRLIQVCPAQPKSDRESAEEDRKARMPQDAQPEIKIRPASFPDDIQVVRRLFLAYAQSIPVKLDFQGFEQELEALPGKYAVENGGAVYLACIPTEPVSLSTEAQTNGASPESSSVPSKEKEQVVGCIALRSFATSNGIKTSELKRLYLTPESRGLGVAKLLMDVALAQARQLGYKEMLLDTLSSMKPARKLYEKYGFEEIESYYESVEDAVFYRLRL